MRATRYDDKPLWNVQQVAAYLNISKRWVYRDGRSYGLPIFMIGRQLRARPADVRAWVEQQRQYGP
ncbi:helix-turn-helix domain-containing protein [Nonomuraea sp. NBC_00507]|uniref:helix-turn-helix domain-containing protein n=1 Tax=Nonomuraea sp. NBC_00507 TaxID=2976002 RepID=UPI002E17E699